MMSRKSYRVQTGYRVQTDIFPALHTLHGGKKFSLLDGKKVSSTTPSVTFAPVRSSISYIDGDDRFLRHRGYPIDGLAESSTFLEVAYLLKRSLPYSNGDDWFLRYRGYPIEGFAENSNFLEVAYLLIALLFLAILESFKFGL
ncbi:Citrate synthase-like protein [Corchorus olitorius]|uniref:Citrate synthase-like protein n=1 Tax=Corchorus olitorius TaxID=93759 RepID=A0A1R3H9Q7_9ROSI|nr:Citrate synthase-like protein [Corchorus olitorius]